MGDGWEEYRRLSREHPRELQAWRNMINRCTNPSNPGYGYYGARGISVCETWLHSFKAFIDDMGPRPSDDHSLDRKDNDGNYEPGNCRWATQKEQANNRRPRGTGKVRAISEAAPRVGHTPVALWQAVHPLYPSGILIVQADDREAARRRADEILPMCTRLRDEYAEWVAADRPVARVHGRVKSKVEQIMQTRQFVTDHATPLP